MKSVNPVKPGQALRLYKLFFIFLFLLAQLQSFSQPYFDVANLYYQHSPDNSLFHSDETHIQTDYFAASVNAVLKMKEDVFLVNPFYETYSADYIHDVHGVSLPLTYLKQWKNPAWKTAFIIIPRINSDFKKVDENDYQLGGALLGIYKKKGNLKYKFGVYYNSEFFGPFILPLLGIDWNISSRLNLFGVLPGSMNLEYKFHKRVHAGVSFRSITSSYRVNDFYFLKINDNHLKLFLDAYVTENIVLTVEAGQSIGRKYQTGLRQNGSTDYFDLNVNDGLLFKAGISYRLRLDEKK